MMSHTPLLLLAADIGGFVSIVKIVPILLLMLVWARLMAWADKDAIVAHMPREGMNAMNLGALILASAAFLLLPGYWIGLGIYLVLFLADAGVYLGFRHKQVGLKDLKKDLANWRQMFQPKQKLELKPGEVTFLAKDGPVEAPDGESPERPAYDATQTILTDPIKKEAEKLEFRPLEGQYQGEYWVDGVAYSLSKIEANAGAACITYLKQRAGMDVEDRRKPQSGKLKVGVGKDRHDLDIATAGSTAGESLRISINPKKYLDRKLDTLGFMPDQLTAIRKSVEECKGVVLLAAPRQQGLTTLLYAFIRSHDGFLQHLQAIERVPREDLEGITQIKLGATGSPADEAKQVEWVTSQQPDVIMVDELVNPASARQLIRFATGPEAKRVYIGMRAGSSFEALDLWRKLVGDDAAAASAVSLIVCGRMLRRLCSACKLSYTPDTDTLVKLNMDPAKVQTLYQARSVPLVDQKGRPVPCDFCHDLRFKGRFGVFETFTIDDEVRAIVQSRGSLEQFKKVFRKQRNRFIQEQALAQVQAGETSVQEVLRVLKGSERRA